MGTVGLAGEATDGESCRRLPPPPLSVSLTSGSALSVADARVLSVSVAAEAGVQRGPRRAGPRRVLGRGRRVLGCASAYSWAAVPWAGPSRAECCFPILFCLFISQIYVHLQKYIVPSI